MYAEAESAMVRLRPSLVPPICNNVLITNVVEMTFLNFLHSQRWATGAGFRSQTLSISLLQFNYLAGSFIELQYVGSITGGNDFNIK